MVNRADRSRPLIFIYPYFWQMRPSNQRQFSTIHRRRFDRYDPPQRRGLIGLLCFHTGRGDSTRSVAAYLEPSAPIGAGMASTGQGALLKTCSVVLRPAKVGGPTTRHVPRVPRMAMKKEESRRAVLSEYDRWVKKHPNQASMMGGFLFFRYLQEEKSDLLEFRAAGNKWQIVHGWLRDRLKD